MVGAGGRVDAVGSGISVAMTCVDTSAFVDVDVQAPASSTSEKSNANFGIKQVCGRRNCG